MSPMSFTIFVESTTTNVDVCHQKSLEGDLCTHMGLLAFAHYSGAFVVGYPLVFYCSFSYIMPVNITESQPLMVCTSFLSRVISGIILVLSIFEKLLR